MSKFNVGDKVQMPGDPFVVEVLEFKACDERQDRFLRQDGVPCEIGDGEVFRFADPESGATAWMHTAVFEKI